MGWLYAFTERLIRSATLGGMRLMALVIGFFALSTLFFFFRDVVFFGVWPIILALVGLSFCIKATGEHH